MYAHQKQEIVCFTCKECPGKQAIRDFLYTDIDNPNKAIKYSSWGTVKTKDEDGKEVTRTTLINFEKFTTQIINELMDDLWNMTEHHFISNKQKDFYAKSKKSLDEKTRLITMDFAENYEFICQNSVQAFYFNNSHASLFTLTQHYKDSVDKTIKVASYCVISDGKDHTAGAVNLFLKVVIDSIKVEFPLIKN